jgi:uncharacterized protein (DUF1778 family)
MAHVTFAKVTGSHSLTVRLSGEPVPPKNSLRPPAGRKMEGVIFMSNKSKMFSFRLSESEYLRIHSKAEIARLTMTAFILSAALNKPVVVIDGLPDTVKELRRIGANVNQLTTLVNMEKIRCVELGGVKEELVKIWRSLNSLTQITG